MSTGGGAQGAYCYRQTRQYHRYEPGKSLLIEFTARLGAPKAGVRQRAGYFDASNGVFWEQTASGLVLVQRSNAGGTPSDATSAAQADWNLDRLDGTGPSGVTLNVINSQIFFIDLQWLGVGRVRCGFVIDGVAVVCHEFKNANARDVVYMSTGNLPIRFEVENTGAAGTATTMDHICATVISEGGFTEGRGLHFSANNGITEIGVTTRRAVLSIRPKATLNSVVVRGIILPDDMFVTARTNTALWEIVYAPTFTGTPTWSSAGDQSIVEYSVHGDAAAGAFSAGYVLESGYVINGAGQARDLVTDAIESFLPLAHDQDGANPTALSLVCTSLTGTANVAASFNWHEAH